MDERMISATHQLISLYKAASVRQITELRKQMPVWAVIKKLTRPYGLCLLCVASRKIAKQEYDSCSVCIHFLVTGCGCMIGNSWDLLIYASTAEELYEAMQGRAAYLEHLLEGARAA